MVDAGGPKKCVCVCVFVCVCVCFDAGASLCMRDIVSWMRFCVHEVDECSWLGLWVCGCDCVSRYGREHMFVI